MSVDAAKRDVWCVTGLASPAQLVRGITKKRDSTVPECVLHINAASVVVIGTTRSGLILYTKAPKDSPR